MISRFKGILFFLFAVSLPFLTGCMKKNNTITDTGVAFIFVFIALIHIISIWAYLGRIQWLRLVCSVLYVPVFLFPLALTLFNPIFVVLFVPLAAFYVFVI